MQYDNKKFSRGSEGRGRNGNFVLNSLQTLVTLNGEQLYLDIYSKRAGDSPPIAPSLNREDAAILEEALARFRLGSNLPATYLPTASTTG